MRFGAVDWRTACNAQVTRYRGVKGEGSGWLVHTGRLLEPLLPWRSHACEGRVASMSVQPVGVKPRVYSARRPRAAISGGIGEFYEAIRERLQQQGHSWVCNCVRVCR